MKNVARIYLALAVAFAVTRCGDKQESADRAQEAQKAIQQGM
jgi:predicted small lipoprotein YifL